MVWVLESFANDSVVVYFAINSKGNGLIAVSERLRSRIDTNDGKTFVGKNYAESEFLSKLHLGFCIPVLLAI